jgi:anti-sigma regulatory factor (Ser/Thr protein kinase)
MPKSHLRFPATLAGFEQGAGNLRALLDAQSLGGVPRYNAELAFEEVVTNIVRHGSPDGDIEVTVVSGEHEIVLTFEDNGVPFDPGGRPDPVVPASIDEAPLGGLGVLLLKKISTRMSYTRTPQCRNQLTLAIPVR